MRLEGVRMNDMQTPLRRMNENGGCESNEGLMSREFAPKCQESGHSI